MQLGVNAFARPTELFPTVPIFDVAPDNDSLDAALAPLLTEWLGFVAAIGVSRPPLSRGAASHTPGWHNSSNLLRPPSEIAGVRVPQDGDSKHAMASTAPPIGAWNPSAHGSWDTRPFFTHAEEADLACHARCPFSLGRAPTLRWQPNRNISPRASREQSPMWNTDNMPVITASSKTGTQPGGFSSR